MQEYILCFLAPLLLYVFFLKKIIFIHLESFHGSLYPPEEVVLSVKYVKEIQNIWIPS